MAIDGQLKLEKIDDEELLAILQARKNCPGLLFEPEKMITYARKIDPKSRWTTPRSYGNVVLSWSQGNGLDGVLSVIMALQQIAAARDAALR